MSHGNCVLSVCRSWGSTATHVAACSGRPTGASGPRWDLPQLFIRAPYAAVLRERDDNAQLFFDGPQLAFSGFKSLLSYLRCSLGVGNQMLVGAPVIVR